jgi:hypothetical protein
MDHLQILQKMPGKKKLEQSFQLSDFVRELAIKNIKEQLGGRSGFWKLEKRLHQRLRKD